MAKYVSNGDRIGRLEVLIEKLILSQTGAGAEDEIDDAPVAKAKSAKAVKGVISKERWVKGLPFMDGEDVIMAPWGLPKLDKGESVTNSGPRVSRKYRKDSEFDGKSASGKVTVTFGNRKAEKDEHRGKTLKGTWMWGRFQDNPDRPVAVIKF